MPAAKHPALDVLAGKWITQGSIRATDDAVPYDKRAIEQYEWLPGGFFMLY